MSKNTGDKTLYIRVPVELHTMVKKLSADLDTTYSEIIINYLEWLNEQHWKTRVTLDATSKEKFDMERKRPGAVQSNRKDK